MTEAVATIKKQILRGEGHFTQTEASAFTGLSLDEVKDAIETLLEKYVCQLQVTENGDLIYDFGKKPWRRGRRPPKEILKDAGDQLWKIFTVVFKIWIALTLVVYFIIFMIILFVVIIAGTGSKKRDRSGRDSIGNAISGIIRIFFSIFQWKTISGNIGYRTDNLGYRFRGFKPKPAVLNEKKKSFIASVYDFVFGPPRVEPDPLNNEKEVASYLQTQKGILTTFDLMSLAGWTLSDAQAFFTDCLVRFQGDVKVTEKEGVMYGEFDQILRGVGKVTTAQVIHYWDEYEPIYEWTGNTAGRNALISLMNGFNLIFAIVIIFNFHAILQMMGFNTAPVHSASGTMMAVGWIPLVFSLIFFLVPLLRYPIIQHHNRKRHENNIRKRMYRAIFDFHGNPMTVNQAAGAVNHNASEEKLSHETVAHHLDTLALDLAGKTDISDTAEVIYSFPRIKDELAAAERLQQQRQLDRDLGKIISDSA